MNKKEIAVVTGGTGFVGSHLVDLLLSKGYEVWCIVRKSSNLRWLNGKNVKLIDCGLNDKNALLKVIKDVDYIFHVAGVVKSKSKEGYFKGNVDTTRNLLEAVVENKVNLKRFVVVGSLTACGPSTDGLPKTELSICNPITTYGKSKLEEEKIALSYKHKVPITICRAPAVYGERDTEIFIYFKTFSKGLTTLIGFDQKKLSLIHVQDLVEGIYLSSQSDRSIGEIYFISSEEFYTWEQINKITSEILNKKALVVRIPHFVVYLIASIAQFLSYFSKNAATLNIEKAKDLTQRYWICDTSKAKEHFGYKQKIDIKEGIKRTVEWYKQKGWL
ncbi:MAG: NAD(P)-dependent oxidoreductase [Ignavibacterium sp.]|nr:NAD(P)-dependent oxidoreductase [Ignavibacterium sp.]